MTWRPHIKTMRQPIDDDSADDAPTPLTDAVKASITAALTEVRKARHHKDCHCRMWQREWCSANEALWSRALNRQLDQLILPD